MILANLGAEPVTIERGERIAQLVIAPVVRASLDARRAACADDTRATGRRVRLDEVGRSLYRRLLIDLSSRAGHRSRIRLRRQRMRRRVRAGRGCSWTRASRRARSSGAWRRGGSRPRPSRRLFLTHEHNDHSSGAPVFARAVGLSRLRDGRERPTAIGLEGDLFSPFVRIAPARDGRIGDLGLPRLRDAARRRRVGRLRVRIGRRAPGHRLGPGPRRGGLRRLPARGDDAARSR